MESYSLLFKMQSWLEAAFGKYTEEELLSGLPIRSLTVLSEKQTFEKTNTVYLYIRGHILYMSMCIYIYVHITHVHIVPLCLPLATTSQTY